MKFFQYNNYRNSNNLLNLLLNSRKYVWSAKINNYIDLDKNGEVYLKKYEYKYTNQNEWNIGLIAEINIASAHIFKSNKRYAANWIIVSDTIWNILKTLDLFDNVNNILSSRFNVYANDNIPFNKIIVGFGDGTNPEYAGIITIYDI